MKIELKKKIDVNEVTKEEEIWYYVVRDNPIQHKFFRTEKEAKGYYEALVAFHQKYGIANPIDEVLYETTIADKS